MSLSKTKICNCKRQKICHCKRQKICHCKRQKIWHCKRHKICYCKKRQKICHCKWQKICHCKRRQKMRPSRKRKKLQRCLWKLDLQNSLQTDWMGAQLRVPLKHPYITALSYCGVLNWSPNLCRESLASRTANVSYLNFKISVEKKLVPKTTSSTYSHCNSSELAHYRSLAFRQG